jgi:uncharacterized protein YggU (UPF0235/DUF167 family)
LNPSPVHRQPRQLSRELEALLDERDHLHVKISLAADDPDANADLLVSMGRRLAELECEIAQQRTA